MFILQPLVLIFLFGLAISIVVYLAVLQGFIIQRKKTRKRAEANMDPNQKAMR